MAICKICGYEFQKLRLHLKVHNINPMDYWVKYVSETHEYPTCRYCHEPINHFINDSFEQGPGIYCNRNCKDSDFSRVLVVRHQNGIYKEFNNLIKYNTDINRRIPGLASTSYYRLLRDTDPYMDGYFYILIIDNSDIKFGASRQDPNYYLDLRYHYLPYEVVRVYKSTLCMVARLEYFIKLNKRFSVYRVSEGFYSSTEELNLEVKSTLVDFTDRIPWLHKLNLQ